MKNLQYVILISLLIIVVIYTLSTIHTDEGIQNINEDAYSTEKSRVAIVQDIDLEHDVYNPNSNTHMSTQDENEKLLVIPKDMILDSDVPTSLLAPKGSELNNILSDIANKKIKKGDDEVVFSYKQYSVLAIRQEDGLYEFVTVTKDFIKPTAEFINQRISELEADEESGTWTSEHYALIRKTLSYTFANTDYHLLQLQCRQMRCVGELEIKLPNDEAHSRLNSFSRSLTENGHSPNIYGMGDNIWVLDINVVAHFTSH